MLNRLLYIFSFGFTLSQPVELVFSAQNTFLSFLWCVHDLVFFMLPYVCFLPCFCWLQNILKCKHMNVILEIVFYFFGIVFNAAYVLVLSWCHVASDGNIQGIGKGKGKGFPCSIPSVGPRADPSVQAVSPQVTVSHVSGGRLPLLSARPAVTFPSAGITTLWPVPSYTAWWQAHKCEQLAQGCYAALPQVGLNLHPLIASPTYYPLRHRTTCVVILYKISCPYRYTYWWLLCVQDY